MRITVTVSTPKHAYIWGSIVPELEERGHEVQVLLREYGETLPVADGIGLEGEIFGRCKGSGYRRLAETPGHMVRHLRLSRRFGPDILAGTGVFETHSARWLRKPGIAITDTEEAPIQNHLTRIFADTVLVPESFQTNPFGDKIRHFPGYLELTYLHPDSFEPDSSVHEKLGLGEGDRFAVLRFNAMDSVHDRSAQGFSTEERIRLVEELAEHGEVFISSEGWLPSELEGYELPTPAHRIHHVLHYADLYVGDSGTMQNEAAVLGTPSVRYSHLPRGRDRGNTVDLAENYGLVENVRDGPEAVERSVRLFDPEDEFTIPTKRREEMLEDKLPVRDLLVWYLLDYPDSDHLLRREPDLGSVPSPI